MAKYEKLNNYPPSHPPAQSGTHPYPPEQGGPPPPPPYHHPQPGQQQQQQQTTVVVGQQPVHVQGVRFRDSPVRTRCPNCNNDVLSNTEYVSGNLVWIIALIIFLLALWPFCLVPLFIPSLKDVHHTCPVCNYQLGKYERANC